MPYSASYSVPPGRAALCRCTLQPACVAQGNSEEADGEPEARTGAGSSPEAPVPFNAFLHIGEHDVYIGLHFLVGVATVPAFDRIEPFVA